VPASATPKAVIMRAARTANLITACFVSLASPAAADDPIGPPTVAQSLAAFRLADPELTVELVASEPDVVSPVALAWDEDGRLFVAEMIDYPVGPQSGRIRLLEDRDGDGRYETSRIFADSLAFPNGVLPWNGGILVTAAPDILFLKDSNGDGRTDERRVVLTGFTEGNQQLRVNGLSWGLDNWIYGANGRSGGRIRRAADPLERAVPIDRHDFRFRPDTGHVEAIAGFSQFGLPRDDWGDRFPSWNTVPIRHVVLEDRVLERNPSLTSATTVASILDSADGGRIYSLAPSQARFNAESVAFFNATCGPTIYRGDLLAATYRGNAFVCEPLSSLVHRRVLIPDGPTYRAERVEQGKEFLASTHPWFRPVNLATGPDGALYVADFCRALVEHPAFVPEAQRGKVDFRRGDDRGRIWRIRPRTATGRRPPPRLRQAPAAELVASLGDANGWWRDTAQRLLIERGGREAAGPLADLARHGPNALARIHALWTLDGIGAIAEPDLLAGLHDANGRVREQAVRLLNTRAAGPDSLRRALVGLAADADARVRFQTAIALGEFPGAERLDAFVRIAARDPDAVWTRWAVLSGLRDSAGSFLTALFDRHPDWLRAPAEGQAEWLVQVGALVGATNRDDQLRTAFERLAGGQEARPAHGRVALLEGIAEGLQRAGRPLRARRDSLDDLAPVLDFALVTANSDSESDARRVRAIDLLARAGTRGTTDLLLACLDPARPAAVQSAAARRLVDGAGPGAITAALERWDTFSRATRKDLIATLVQTLPAARALVDGIDGGQVALAELDAAARDALVRVADPPLRTRVEKLLAQSGTTDRRAVVDRYAPSLDARGDPRHGALVFAQNCQTCHVRQGNGNRVGPDLSGIGSRPPQMLLADILDPNREVAPDYVAFLLATREGKVLSGILAEETSTSLRLRLAGGIDETVARVEIVELRPTGRSLMPEGIEQALGVQDVADLLSYLRQAVDSPAAAPR
jgi:putative membrane-bound dehydrogenase-like protein